MAPQREWFEKDYYAVLGLRPEASDKEVARAYRQLAKQHHPDANAGDRKAEERFKEMSAAYEVLGDAAKRKEYDDVRKMVASGIGAPGGFGPTGGPGAGNFRFEHINDLGDLGGVLGGLFGRRGRGESAGGRRGADLEAELHLSFDDVLSGVTTAVRLTSEAPCATCGGSGAAPGSAPVVCSQCQGIGNLAVEQGPFSFSRPCPRCGGAGRVVEQPCRSCAGRGAEVRPREVKVRIPAGVADAQRIRVKGRGAPGAGQAAAGDLFVTVHVAAHPLFGRRGDDLTLSVPVTFAEAALGAQIRLPTLDDPVTVRIPPGTQSGRLLRVRSRGMPRPKGGHGDLLVAVEVAVPRSLTDEERQAVEALASVTAGNPRAHLGV